MIVTFADAIDYVLNYLAKDASQSPEAKRIVINAYRVIANKRDWNYYKRFYRLNTVAAQATGTITYTESTRTVVLVGATWPSWAIKGYLRIGQVMYNIASVTNSTTLILSAATTPGVDLDPLTSYILMQDAYPLPSDFRSIIGINWQSGTYNPAYLELEEFIALSTLVTGPAAPSYYTIYGDRSVLGIKDIRFYPAPDQAFPTNLYYNGAGRPLTIDSYLAGDASTTADSATVTGSGTVWTSAMIGSVIRFAAETKKENGKTIYPTGVDGLYPFTMERVVVAVASATSLTVDSVADVTLANVPYIISDPIDVNEGAMMDYFYRLCDYQARRSMRSKEISKEESDALVLSLQEALEADSVYSGTRVAMAARHRPRMLRDYPITLSG